MQGMVLKRFSQTIDRVECGRRDVVERTPVVRDEVFRLESLEQRERIAARQVPLAKSGLPPRRVADGQQGQIQRSSPLEKVPFHEMSRIRHQRSITGKEARGLVSIY